MQALKSFIAGFISTLVFHQGVLAIFHVAGISPRAPFAMTPVPPLNIPSVISLAFWGGLWGIALWYMIRGSKRARYWTLAAVIGAIGPTAVALLVVLPLKGMPLGGGWDPKLIIGGLILNGAWGLGVAWMMRLMQRG